MGLAPEKILLKWMNFHLKKAGYEKQVTNFSSDIKVRINLVLLLHFLLSSMFAIIQLSTFFFFFWRMERHMHIC